MADGVYEHLRENKKKSMKLLENRNSSNFTSNFNLNRVFGKNVVLHSRRASTYSTASNKNSARKNERFINVIMKEAETKANNEALPNEILNISQSK